MASTASNGQGGVAQPLAWGQLSLAAGLLVCFVLKPEFLQSEGGFSNYGVVAVTIPFFTIAFVGAAAGTFLAARRTRSRQASALTWSLYALAGLFVAVLATTYPYKRGHLYGELHQVVSIVFGAWEILLGTWLVSKQHDALNMLFFGVQLVAGIVTIITIQGFTHLLFVGELVEGAGFGALLVRAAGQLAAKGAADRA